MDSGAKKILIWGTVGIGIGITAYILLRKKFERKPVTEVPPATASGDSVTPPEAPITVSTSNPVVTGTKPASTPTLNVDKVLKLGVRSPEVKSLQNGLNKVIKVVGGLPMLSEDGDFGPKTKEALEKYAHVSETTLRKAYVILQRALGG